MSTPINITINVNVPRQPTPSEERAAGVRAMCAAFQRMWDNVVATAKKEGAPEFKDFGDTWTHAQYQKAARAYFDRKDKERRKQLGFWKYHFGP